MSSTLKAFVAKLKSRRKSRLWRQRRSGRLYEDDGEEAKILTKEMASLSITSTDGDPKVHDADSPIPHIFGRPNFKHDFELPAVYQTWPGPSYDEKSQFAPGIFDKPRHPKRRPRQKSSKRRLSHDERPAPQRRDDRAAAQVVKAVTRITRTSRQPQYYGSPPARDPPNHLLNLPGEIRNEVYRMLCLSEEAIFAQFRVVIKPRQGRGDKAHTIRRLPREPAVALVCHQVQREALSLFYSRDLGLPSTCNTWRCISGRGSRHSRLSASSTPSPNCATRSFGLRAMWTITNTAPVLRSASCNVSDLWNWKVSMSTRICCSLPQSSPSREGWRCKQTSLCRRSFRIRSTVQLEGYAIIVGLSTCGR